MRPGDTLLLSVTPALGILMEERRGRKSSNRLQDQAFCEDDLSIIEDWEADVVFHSISDILQQSIDTIARTVTGTASTLSRPLISHKSGHEQKLGIADAQSATSLEEL